VNYCSSMIFREENHKSPLKNIFQETRKVWDKSNCPNKFRDCTYFDSSTKLFLARYKFILYVDISEKSFFLWRGDTMKCIIRLHVQNIDETKKCVRHEILHSSCWWHVNEKISSLLKRVIYIFLWKVIEIERTTKVSKNLSKNIYRSKKYLNI